eukprot:3316570-Lingulodinium_polyedra.AAC.1
MPEVLWQLSVANVAKRGSPASSSASYMEMWICCHVDVVVQSATSLEGAECIAQQARVARSVSPWDPGQFGH